LADFEHFFLTAGFALALGSEIFSLAFTFNSDFVFALPFALPFAFTSINFVEFL
jgi:hypothetical protein